MIPGFTNGSEGLHNLYGNWTQEDDVVSSSLPPPEDTHSTSLLYNLSLLFDKCHQVQSNLRTFISPSQPPQPPESTPMAIANMGTLIQEIIITASSMMFTCQQMALGATLGDTNTTTTTTNHDDQLQQQQEHHQVDDWYGDGYNICSNNELDDPKSNIYDIIELDAADLLAKYTHYCQVCGKGFKRDANLRMHMRAHGDEYKSTAALINPMKNNDAANGDGTVKSSRKKYSCPQEGCRWNRRHAKFQPLKSMICVKNHYKRSHCPKMYVCKRCNVKQFSVLSDLRTHEKHCGDLRWQCSCGTTFSRKDKLLGHVALFVGHTPAVNSLRN